MPRDSAARLIPAPRLRGPCDGPTIPLARVIAVDEPVSRLLESVSHIKGLRLQAEHSVRNGLALRQATQQGGYAGAVF
jgi:hypothetical protein